MEQPVKVPAFLEKVTTLKDGSVRILFETQELDVTSCTNLFQMRQALGWLVFAPQSLKEVEILDEPVRSFKEEKTPSQRLRAVLFVLWKQLGSKGVFNDFYEKKMGGFVESVKEYLNPENED